METLFTVEEAAELMKVKVDTVRRWLRNGTLRGRKIGRIWRIAESDLSKLGQDTTTSSKSL
jgi:acetyl-CoA synthetase